MRPLKHTLLLACGWTALGLGAAGVVVPVLPTVPFLLLAAACFMRSSPRWHSWLVTHPLFGRHIDDYLAKGCLAARTKVTALTMLWASVLLSIVVFVPLFAVDLLLLAIAAAVSVYLLRLPTCAAGPVASDPALPQGTSEDEPQRDAGGPC